jgi:hypothetical protein
VCDDASLALAGDGLSDGEVNSVGSVRDIEGWVVISEGTLAFKGTLPEISADKVSLVLTGAIDCLTVTSAICGVGS